MPNTFVAADLHLGHKNIVNYGRPFATVADHDVAVIKNINDTVTPSDILHIFGDVVFPQTGFEALAEIKCRNMFLYFGNHERHKLEKYLKYFKGVHAMKQFKNMIGTHIPLHPGQYSRFGTNIHGHLHHNEIVLERVVEGVVAKIPDPRYLCISLEHTDYRPISLDEVRDRVAKRVERFRGFEAFYDVDLTIGGERHGPG